MAAKATVQHCRICDPPKRFNSKSQLQKHVWQEHPELYKNRPNSQKTPKRGRPPKELELPTVTAKTTEGLTARELLAKLIDQRTFINEVIGLLQGMIENK